MVDKLLDEYELSSMKVPARVKLKAQLQRIMAAERLDELKRPIDLHIDDSFSGHYKNGFSMAVNEYEKARELRIAQLEQLIAAGEEE